MVCDDCREKEERKSYPIVCSDCGKDGTVPFKPYEGSPVRCKDCFAARKR